MCGRFTVGSPVKIEKRFKTSNKLTFFKSSYNIAPSQTLPVIKRDSPNKIVMMKWGLLWSKTASHGSINIRSETTKEKPFFKRFLLNKRCVIPADGFYEWGTLNLEGKDEKYPYHFYLTGRKLFGFAGIYNDFKDAEGKPYYTFALLTCPPNKVVKRVHHRMPVILDKKDEDSWLNSETNDFEKLSGLLKPYPPSEMKMNIVSKRVNSPINDDKDLIKEIDHKKQEKFNYGLLGKKI